MRSKTLGAVRHLGAGWSASTTVARTQPGTHRRRAAVRAGSKHCSAQRRLVHLRAQLGHAVLLHDAARIDAVAFGEQRKHRRRLDLARAALEAAGLHDATAARQRETTPATRSGRKRVFGVHERERRAEQRDRLAMPLGVGERALELCGVERAVVEQPRHLSRAPNHSAKRVSM